MKKILIFLFVLIALVAIGVTIFVFTFDVNSLKPYLQEQIQKQVGQPVEISRISLGWQNGIALNVSDLQVYKDQARQATPLLDVKNINGHLNASALLQSRLEVSSITIDQMKLHVRRDQNGNIRGLENIGKNASGGSSSGQATSLILLIKDIFVQDSEIFYQDDMLKDVAPVVLSHIDVHVQDVSLTGPIKIDAKSSLYSSRQNLDIEGILRLNLLNQTIHLNDWKFRTDLKDLNLQKIRTEQPFFKDVPLENAEGQLSLELPELIVRKGAVEDARFTAVLNQGLIHSGATVLPIKQFAGNVELLNNSLTLSSAKLELEQGQVVGSGSLSGLDQDPALNFNFIAKDIYLPQFVKARKGDPYFDGILTLTFKGEANAIKSLGAANTLQGQGLVLINEAVLRNVNILDQVFGSLSMIPGLVDRLKSRLSEEYRNKFNEPDTKLKDVKLPFEMAQGKIFMSQINIESDQFWLEGRAEANIEGSVLATLMLRIDRYLSEAFTRSVEELKYLTNERGEMEIPVQVKGRAPAIKILPNLQYIASKLAVSKTQDLISGFLNPKKEQTPAQQDPAQAAGGNTQNPAASVSSQQTTAPQPSKKATVESLFGQLLQDVLAPQPAPSSETKTG